MGEKIVVGPVGKGLKTNVKPFFVDNDSFPTLTNAYQWRGRIKRKRGTSQVGRLQRYYDSTSVSYNPSATTITLNGSGEGNLITGYSLETNAALIPKTISITGVLDTYTDDNGDGILYDVGGDEEGNINYADGSFTIDDEGGNGITSVFRYYPAEPVMGLEDFFNDTTTYQKTLAFDQTYSYNISTTTPAAIYNVSYYKNPPSNPNLTNYVPKTNISPLNWNGGDYQQFFSTNYRGAFWVTNGMDVPFTGDTIGIPFKFITNIANITASGPASCDLTIASHGLVIGDFVYINEVPSSVLTGINFQTGYVTAVVSASIVTVTFPNATLAGGGGAITADTAVAIYLTSSPDSTKDCIRWYDGDPTSGSATAPVLNGRMGWVNFCPPISQLAYSINNLTQDVYYLVGCKMLIPFVDRMLFIGPVVQTKAGSPIYLEDTVFWSQNGTPYYTTSFTGDDPTDPDSIQSLLVPTNETAFPPAYWADVTGFAGWKSSGLSDPITTVGFDGDAIIFGFPSTQTRFVYTQNDFSPFNFYQIDNELGSGSTFSAIDMDKGVITRGKRGYVITGQTSAQRVDIEVPQDVFEIKLNNQGAERVTAQRDYENEWIYFSYPDNEFTSKFNTRTLLLNYRDGTWGIFNESYTTYGLYRPTTGYTWATIGTEYPTWSDWNVPWKSGATTLLQPDVIAGTTQGYVMKRAVGTGEQASIYISDISSNTVTSYNHCLNENDFIIIKDAVGSVSSEVNGKLFQVNQVTDDTFILAPPLSGTLDYQGNGQITRLYRPEIQTRQFPVSWELMRKTRLGVQQYLFDATDTGQVTLQIFLSQNSNVQYNEGPIVPTTNSFNNALVYNTVLFTCPESTNLGLTAPNINLNSPTAFQQQQIWHRMNTSLLGDTVQIGITLSDEQMSSYNDIGIATEITGATQANPCVLTCNGAYSAGTMLKISDIDIDGMVELNFTESEYNYYQVLSSDSTTVTIDVDATGFTAYTSGGTAQPVKVTYPTDEIVLHSFILDVQPSSLLA